jgi:NAD(P)-dependent dehydrogenase (short-subunit alcohol dehydrogenase family)
MTEHLRRDPGDIEQLLARVPMKRLGLPDDIAGTCIFLCSRAGSYITGSRIYLDGGMAGCR